ncbi:2Fe-2S iron-sulfur cluster-binding protein [Haliea sp.]|jgi:2Fe-2S ferredoxin|uniref:2Fe-2S iron-sulfur cluster-binding protein n=1 Tax=Haliea TaxID=475794 RepID=UPI000C3964E8|nr:2Fe-2S iron-sulfur cluster-binding protein [Haliea sp.]HCD57293.1 (2Fe-2S)-binding protein [Halieaceae bacterium]MAD62147.1 (2Fe-2S)-binding protein [Haliea sp.]MAY93850.1 (2Fe-2S)-binding protein [Haliea sp.]MBK41609.1 (2Fe-2S)-binding protein [Haliea sp.]MBP70871.1 (2Fe-2S)-binding protein [Haliea sp.]|tara:strand:- start:5604 stop:5924 length:321 start_codon:yes stop_codon:yes gene_type:complete
MANVIFVDPAGAEINVEVATGTSLMQAAMDNGIDYIVAECGGACSCATCHCYIDNDWLAKIGEPSSIEKDMLDCVLEPRPNSRLSCQVVIDENLEGLVVHLPESQF